jgi:hypothetical protein
MPMMRRGPLDRYPAEWVLRQAHAHRASGGIEFHTERPVTIHVHEGRVYAACEGVGAEADVDALSGLAEHEARAAVVALIAEVLGHTAGWYYLDPLAHAPERGAWTWETATLLMDTRARAHETQALAAWTDRPVELRPSVDGPVSFSPDAWAVVVACTSTTTADHLCGALGWSPERLVVALTEIERRGVLDPEPAGRPRPASSGGAAVPPNPEPRRHQGPLPPPPPISAGSLARTPEPADAKGLRRRIPGRKVSSA